MSTATATCPMPSAEDVGSLLGDLVGRTVTAEASRPRLRRLQQLAIATYATVEHDLVAACLCDLAVAANLGASLAMVPATIANQSLSTGTLSSELLENCTEVLNVASRWVNAEGSPRLILGRLVAPRDEVPEDVLHLLEHVGVRVDFHVEIDGYGGGMLSVVGR